MIFAQFDIRLVGTEANEAIFHTQCGKCDGSSGQVDGLDCPCCGASGNAMVYGVEVTIPALASRCAINLDHHAPSDTAETPSACIQALTAFLPYENSVITTVRPDVDSVTAMAILKNRLEEKTVDLELVSGVDTFDRLGPSAGKPAPVVLAIARKACDFKLTLEERVRWVSEILAGDSKEEEIAELVSAHDTELGAAKKASEVTLCAGGGIATVVSTHRFATNLGYAQAPVVIAMNPAFPVDPKDLSKGTYRKFTVCRYDSHVQCDLPSALKELQALEPAWGGRGDIFGSPQGVSSELTLDQVVEVGFIHGGGCFDNGPWRELFEEAQADLDHPRLSPSLGDATVGIQVMETEKSLDEMNKLIRW